jgi:exodeoxyribonuclease-3
MPLRIASWNINSVRLRLPLLKNLIEAANPDIICLQETKVPDELFPQDGIKALGYSHIAICGEKGYNGVAILSRIPFHASETVNFTDITQCRHLAVTLSNGVEVHNFYVPAGGDIPDPKENPKFDHKLRFVDDMLAWFKKHRKATDKMILTGDLNIAPLEHDVWSHKQLLDVVSHTPVEVEKLTALQKGLTWIDSHRKFTPHNEKLYSWWSYRNRDWRKSDRGRRLDHIWVTPALEQHLVSASILKDARDWPTPSDHVPIIAELHV